MRQGISFVEGAGGGYFSQFFKPGDVDPDAALSELDELRNYMGTQEYAGIKKMMMSLRFFEPGTTPPETPQPEITPEPEATGWPEREKGADSKWEGPKEFR